MTASSLFRSRSDHKKKGPVLVSAPMAGISHSAFRRLLAQFGGYSALYTEMLPTHSLLSENTETSPFLRRRPQEGKVVYQIVVTGKASPDVALRHLLKIEPFCIDINLGCPAPAIVRYGGGQALFDDIERLEKVLGTVRDVWQKPLTVKCRLGRETKGWQEDFLKRLDLFHRFKVDALCLHPRFSHEKLKRKARWHLFEWLREYTDLPLIGNGDMVDERALEVLGPKQCDALMIGREAVRRPWVFSELCGERATVDYWQVWEDFYRFTLEDFAPERALGKIKEFTAYYAGNFKFGHELFRKVQPAENCEVAYERAQAFLASFPAIVRR